LNKRIVVQDRDAQLLVAGNERECPWFSGVCVLLCTHGKEVVQESLLDWKVN